MAQNTLPTTAHLWRQALKRAHVALQLPHGVTRVFQECNWMQQHGGGWQVGRLVSQRAWVCAIGAWWLPL